MLNADEVLRGGEHFCHRQQEGATIIKGKILVIDDELSVGDALRIIFEDEGYEAVVALTGLEGLALARRLRFDLVISDVRLPDVSGLEVLDALCGECPGCAVILITAHGTSKLSAEARARGAFGVLQKPFLPSEALSLISAALREIRLTNERAESPIDQTCESPC